MQRQDPPPPEAYPGGLRWNCGPRKRHGNHKPFNVIHKRKINNVVFFNSYLPPHYSF